MNQVNNYFEKHAFSDSEPDSQRIKAGPCGAPRLYCKLSDRTDPIKIDPKVQRLWAQYTPSNWSIEKVEIGDISKVALLAKNWSKLAGDKHRNRAHYPIDRAKLEDSESVHEDIYTLLNSPGFEPDKNEVYLCKDRSNQPQGIAIVRKGEEPMTSASGSMKWPLELRFLTTHPKNLRLRSVQKEAPVIGTGSALFQRAAKRALELNCDGIWFIESESGSEFYNKLGVDEGTVQPVEARYPHWARYMTAQKIQTLIYE
ncbi:MAG: hypothetical protein JSS32_08190 [Verrucomicrobia bacterium]|nr:hypothetical protein [Verrucomicrobiota bacterium]